MGLRVATYYCSLALLLSFWTNTAKGQDIPDAIYRISYNRDNLNQIIAMIDRGFSLKSRDKDSSLLLLHTALQKSRDIHYSDGIGYACYLLGFVYSISENLDSAIRYTITSIPYLKRSDNYKRLTSGAYSNIGACYTYQGNYPQAILYLDSALKERVRQKLSPENRHHVTILNNLGGIHFRLKQVKQALEYLDQAETISTKAEFTRELAMVLGNKGEIYSALQDNDSAEYFFQKGVNLLKGTRDVEELITLAGVKNGLAELKLKQGKPKETILILKEVEQLIHSYSKLAHSINPGYIMGLALLQVGDYAHAERYLTRALKESHSLNINDNLMNIHQALSQVYDSLGQYKKSLFHQRQYEQLKDSLLSKEKARDINELDIKYRTAEKDRSIIQNQLQISRQQNRLNRQTFLITGISLAAILLVVVLVARSRLNSQRQKNMVRQIHILEQQQELMQSQQEIQHLKDVVQGEEKERVRIAGELHDGIVSQLMAVRLHFKAALQHAVPQPGNKKDFENTLQYLDEATKELRKTAHNLMPEIVLQNGLLPALRTYCEKMSRAIPVILQDYGTPARYLPDAELSLYRIVQELVQNAIKHAQAGQVVVELTQEQDQLSITVEDNGQGLPQAESEDIAGMGLKSVFTRVKALGGHIDITSVPGKGTAFNIEFDPRAFAADPDATEAG